jgi:hypothetical protein
MIAVQNHPCLPPVTRYNYLEDTNSKLPLKRTLKSNGYHHCGFYLQKQSLINNSPEKSILNDIGNVVFLKAWKHTVKNASTNVYLTMELGPWLEKLHRESQRQVGQSINDNRGAHEVIGPMVNIHGVLFGVLF